MTSVSIDGLLSAREFVGRILSESKAGAGVPFWNGAIAALDVVAAYLNAGCKGEGMNGRILHEAAALLNGERQEAYGPPADNLGRVAAMWTLYLGRQVSAKDVCLLLALLKICREMHTHKRDNLVDAAGYIGLAGDTAGGQ